MPARAHERAGLAGRDDGHAGPAERLEQTNRAPLTGTGVLWTVALSAIFLGRSELVGRRLVVVALLVVAGGALVGPTR